MTPTPLRTSPTAPSAAESIAAGNGSVWDATCQRFLAAVAPHQREEVTQRLRGLHNGGSGMRDWMSAVAWRNAVLPDRIPREIIDVYLADPEAAPLHDCERCGLAVPVRPSPLHGPEGEPDERYFPACPACGGRTGWFLYFTHQVEENITTRLRRRPR